MTPERVLLGLAWCGPAFVVVFFAGAIMAGLIPPPDATDSAEQIATFWQTDTDVKRAGLVLMMIAGGLSAPFSVAVAMVIKRIEGAFSPLTYLALMGGALGVVAILLPTMLFMGPAFRPESRPPEITYALMDLAVIPFIINYPPALIQFVALGLGILSARGDDPPVPRWVGWYSIWTAFLFIPGAFLLFFKTGAWAWDGFLSFWFVATIFGTWFLVVFHHVRGAIRRGAVA